MNRICKDCGKKMIEEEACECARCRRTFCADHVASGPSEMIAPAGKKKVPKLCDVCYRLKYKIR